MENSKSVGLTGRRKSKLTDYILRVKKIMIKMEPRTPLDLEDYHEMKKSFLAKFSDREAWGNQISSKRLRAIDDVVDFITKTELNPEVIEEELRARIEAENEEVLLGNFILMPDSIRKTLIFCYEGNYSKTD